MGLISRVSSRTYRLKYRLLRKKHNLLRQRRDQYFQMRFAKREAGKWASYNIKDATSWSEQQKESKKLTNKLLPSAHKPAQVSNKKQRVRLKNHFENALLDAAKSDRKSRKKKKTEDPESDEADTPKLLSSLDKAVAQSTGGEGIFKFGGGCH